jgi:hypothetical protein
MINDEQRHQIKELLILRGLTFKPLQGEMIDHICCDIEEAMAQGVSFDNALSSTMSSIPENHFKTIQIDTMNTLQKQFTLSRWLSYAALAFLFCSVVFKILHLKFTNEVLLISLGLVCVSLLSASIAGVHLNREKRGAIRVLGVVIGVIILIVGFSFKILHLPGADQILVTSVIVLIAALLANTFFVYRNAAGEENLLTFLHEKYTPGIERFLLILLLPITLFKIITILNGSQQQFIGGLILLVTIFGGGLQLIALSWSVMERGSAHRNPSMLMGIILSFMCLTLTFLGNIVPVEMRILMIAAYSAVSAWIAFKMQTENSIATIFLACLVPLLFFGWAMVRLGVLPTESYRLIFNIPVLLLLVVGLFLCKKNHAMRAYMIASVSGYLFEYSY